MPRPKLRKNHFADPNKKIKITTGRPSKYKPEFAKLLEEHLARGYSIESFASHDEVNAHKDTLYEWIKVHPAFSDAFIKGRARGLRHMEELGYENMMAPSSSWSWQIYKYLMAVQYEKNDRQPIVVNTTVQNKLEDDSDITALVNEIKQLIKEK